MGKVTSYIIVNDVIMVKPTEMNVEVSSQQEIEELRKPLEEQYGLAEKNRKIEEENKYNDKTISKYQVLFSVWNDRGEHFHP